MKKNNKLWNGVTTLMLSVLLLSAGGNLLAQASPPGEVLRAAQKGLADWASMFGRVSDDENDIQVTDAKLGFGFQIYTVNPGDIINQKSRRISDITYAMPIWNFSINSKGNPICLMTVESINGKYEATAIGAVGLAQEMNQVIQELPKNEFKIRFVRIYQATSDLIEATNRKSSVTKYAMLKAARVSLDRETNKAYSLGDIKSSLYSNEEVMGLVLGNLLKQPDLVNKSKEVSK